MSTEIATDYSYMTFIDPSQYKGGVASENDFKVTYRQNRLLDVLKWLECTKPGFLRLKANYVHDFEFFWLKLSIWKSEHDTSP